MVGTQTYTGAVTLGADITFTAGNDITFNSTVDSDTTPTPRSLTISNGSNNITFGDVVGETFPLNNLNITGNGNTNLAANINTVGNQTYSGNVTLTEANVTLDSTQEAGSGVITILGNVTTNVLGSSNFNINAISNSNAINGDISGAINLYYTSISNGSVVPTGVLTLTAANDYIGTTNISQGATLALSGLGSIGNSSSINVDGTFDISQVSNSGTSIIALNDGGNVGGGLGIVNLGNKTLTIGSIDNTGSYSGQINDGGIVNNAGGSLVITGSGYTQTLLNNNFYSGTTDIHQGATLVLNGLGSIANSSSVNVDGTFDISSVGSGGGGNLLINGSFELGDGLEPTGWTFTGDGSFTGVNICCGSAYLGNNYYGFGSVSYLANLTQTIATVPGQQYFVKVWTRNEGGGYGTQFFMSFGGQPLIQWPNIVGSDSQYSQSTFVFRANASSSSLVLSGFCYFS
jgi:autotransporter-associated beta strand protein